MSSRFYIPPETLNDAWDSHWQAYLAEISRKNALKLLEDKK